MAITAYQVHMGPRKDPIDLIAHAVIFFLILAVAWNRIREQWMGLACSSQKTIVEAKP